MDDQGGTNINKVWASITCPSCSRTYNLQMKRPKFQKNCGCGGGSWMVEVTGIGGDVKGRVEVHLNFIFADGREQAVQPNSVTVDED